jgi:hypothetical protein
LSGLPPKLGGERFNASHRPAEGREPGRYDILHKEQTVDRIHSVTGAVWETWRWQIDPHLPQRAASPITSTRQGSLPPAWDVARVGEVFHSQACTESPFCRYLILSYVLQACALSLADLPSVEPL